MGQNNSSNIMATGQNALSTGSELLIAANPQRIGLIIKSSSTDINTYIGFNSSVAANNGHLIGFLGDVTIMYYTGPVYAIAASATPTVTYMEW